jgi:apolipoprotein N-acyltransferase
MARYLLALLAGVLIAFSLPPWGWWPLALLGLALMYRTLEGRSPRARLLLGWLTGLGMLGIGIVWFGEFSIPGAVLSIVFEAVFIAVAGLLTPPTRGRVVAFPAALALTEVARGAFPFGGIPLAGVSLGQVHGPLAPFARVTGGLGLLVLAAVAGMGLLALARRRLVPALLAVGVVVVAAGLGAVAPDGGPDARAIPVALVQGGGPRGFRAVETDPTDVENRHFAATDAVSGRPELVMWPEDVVDVDERVERTREGSALADLAQGLGSTLVVGVVEGEGTDHFRNMVVAWGPDGGLVGRYEKVRRVPFGEYVPFRSFVKRIADLSAVPADAIPGTRPGLLRTPAGRLGVLISYEVFFNDRGRHAVNAGGEVLLVPTNAASFSTSQVPTQELAAASLRALETGRWLAQAGPTGYTAIVTPRGKVLDRSRLGVRRVVTGTLHARHGRTLFVRFGDAPLTVLAALAVLAGLAAQARAAAPREHPD